MEKSLSECLDIRFRFSYGSPSEELGYKGLLPVLEQLEVSNLPRPSRLEFAGKRRGQIRKKTIHSYLAPQLLAILEPEGLVSNHIMITNDNSQESYICVFCSQASVADQLAIRISISLADQIATEYLKKFFIDLIKIFPKVHFAHCTFGNYLSEFDKKYMYQNNRGAHYMNFLVWLQYVSATELAAQGGCAAFEANSLLKTTSLHDGLLVEVGESPQDVFTDEGEALLLKATLSLPPVQYLS